MRGGRPLGCGSLSALPSTMLGVYVPRSPATGVLYGVVRAHLADFLTTVAARTDG